MATVKIKLHPKDTPGEFEGLQFEREKRYTPAELFSAFSYREPSVAALQQLFGSRESELMKVLSNLTCQDMYRKQFNRENSYENLYVCGDASVSLGILASIQHYAVSLVHQQNMPVDKYTTVNHVFLKIGEGEDKIIVDGGYKQFLAGRIPDEQLAKLPNILILPESQLKEWVTQITENLFKENKTITWTVPQFAAEHDGMWETMVEKPSKEHVLSKEELLDLLMNIWTSKDKVGLSTSSFKTFVGQIVGGLERRSPNNIIFRNLCDVGVVEVIE